MQPDHLWSLALVEMAARRIAHAFLQLRLVVGLRKDRLAHRARDVSALGRLFYDENNFAHKRQFSPLGGKPDVPLAYAHIPRSRAATSTGAPPLPASIGGRSSAHATSSRHASTSRVRNRLRAP